MVPDRGKPEAVATVPVGIGIGHGASPGWQGICPEIGMAMRVGSWMKHPVVGDETYGSGRDKTIVDSRIRGQVAKLGRQFLHAGKLGFRHPRTNEPLEFSADLPVELSDLLKLLTRE